MAKPLTRNDGCTLCVDMKDNPSHTNSKFKEQQHVHLSVIMKSSI